MRILSTKKVTLHNRWKRGAPHEHTKLLFRYHEDDKTYLQSTYHRISIRFCPQKHKLTDYSCTLFFLHYKKGVQII